MALKQADMKGNQQIHTFWWCRQAERGKSRPAAAADGAAECFMWEWRLSRGATCQGSGASFPVLIGDQPRGPRCSAACHACPSHTAALRSVTLGPSLKHWRRFVIVCLVSRWLLCSLKPDWRKCVKLRRGKSHPANICSVIGPRVLKPSQSSSRRWVNPSPLQKQQMPDATVICHVCAEDTRTEQRCHVIMWYVLHVNCHTLILCVKLLGEITGDKVTGWPSAKKIKNIYLIYHMLAYLYFILHLSIVLFLWFECRHFLIWNYFMDS